MKTCAFVLALALGASEAFVAPHAAKQTTQLNIHPVNGGVEGSSLLPGPYDRVPMTVLKKDQSQGGQARSPRSRETRLPNNIPPNGELIMTTGGLEVTSKMTGLSPAQNLALASARTTGTISTPYLAAENLAPPGTGMEKQGLAGARPLNLAPPPPPAGSQAPALGGAGSPPPMREQAPATYGVGMPAPVAYDYAGR